MDTFTLIADAEERQFVSITSFVAWGNEEILYSAERSPQYCVLIFPYGDRGLSKASGFIVCDSLGATGRNYGVHVYSKTKSGYQITLDTIGKATMHLSVPEFYTDKKGQVAFKITDSSTTHYELDVNSNRFVPARP
ncbi:MAG: hypothetical protein JST40_00355 [Armatimonadetes bacterium]|nr:hypothetical protein [Armatimonadota bacterium]